MLRKHKLATILLLLLTNIMLPLNVFAYSDYILAGGQNIGIELDSDGIIIVGTYDVSGVNPAQDASLKAGDKIVSINGTKVSSIAEMLKIIGDNTDTIKLGYTRGRRDGSTELKLIRDSNDVYKTGLYVKDSINGVGTLTFIDPNTKIYGALGHEIIEKTTGQKLEIKDDKKSSKNMLFEVTDNELLKISGGIVQGMSGSPIIQGDNIIGAVTHVVVDDPTKGYGIFITNMLEEAEN